MDDTETTYEVGELYTPEAECGLRFDDPRLGVEWPMPVTDVSPKDRAWRLLGDVEPGIRARMTRPKTEDRRPKITRTTGEVG